MLRLLIATLPFAVLTTMTPIACTGGKSHASVTGTWITTTQIEKCNHCRTRFGFDLYENPQGLVAGIGGVESQNSQDATAGAEYLAGPRVGDSIDLIFTLPCESTPRHVIQGFRGRIAASGDSLYGDYWAQRLVPDTGQQHVSLILHRGAIDTAVLEQFQELRGVCK